MWLSHVSGVAIVNLHEANSADEWRRQARLALASARQSDVGTRCYYSESLRQWERYQGRAEQMIRGALANRGVCCYLQPIVDIVAGTARGFEALMRLEDPAEGLINPGAFVEVAERTGLIAPLWEMLMEQALPVLKDPGMRERFGETFLISVNLSPRQLMDSRLLELMLAACARHGVAQSRLQVEVTESAVLSDPVRASRMLERMRAAGIQVAMDDFGSGYSSLAQLTSLPLDTVKIDRSLVLDVSTLPRKQHVLAAVVALCQRLEHGVVVEVSELRPGSPVVHQHHGVGRYQGLETLTAGGVAAEFLALEYAGGAKLYVPVDNLQLISRYAGASDELAPLHKLGSDSWDKAKRKAAEKVRDTAAELLDIYADRKSTRLNSSHMSESRMPSSA